MQIKPVENVSFGLSGTERAVSPSDELNRSTGESVRGEVSSVGWSECECVRCDSLVI